MKIGLVLPDVPQYSETFFNIKIKGLLQSGFDVIVFSGTKTKQKFFFDHANGYPIYTGKPLMQTFLFGIVLATTFIFNMRRSLKLFTLERNEGRSIVSTLKIIYMNAHILHNKLDWLHFGYATMTLNRENVAKSIGAKMGVSFRGYDINIYPLKHPGCYNLMWKNVNKIHSISNYLYEKALSLGLSSEKPFDKISPAIDLQMFEMKEEPGKIDAPLRILTIGRLNWIKDYETAISAMKILKDNGVDFTFKIIGTGKDMERLKFAVHQLDLKEKIFFLGQISHKEIAEKMKESNVYIQTSLEEGFCVSVLEAQASGLLCLVSDARGLKENIINEITGWVVAKRSPKKLAEKIMEIKNLSPDKRKEVALAARKRVKDNFNIEMQRTKFNNFFSN